MSNLEFLFKKHALPGFDDKSNYGETIEKSSEDLTNVRNVLI
jgi:hypothetical protein